MLCRLVTVVIRFRICLKDESPIVMLSGRPHGGVTELTVMLKNHCTRKLGVILRCWSATVRLAFMFNATSFSVIGFIAEDFLSLPPISRPKSCAS